MYHFKNVILFEPRMVYIPVIELASYWYNQGGTYTSAWTGRNNWYMYHFQIQSSSGICTTYAKLMLSPEWYIYTIDKLTRNGIYTTLLVLECTACWYIYHFQVNSSSGIHTTFKFGYENFRYFDIVFIRLEVIHAFFINFHYPKTVKFAVKRGCDCKILF